MARTAIVILNWNTEQYLRQFLPAVLHSAGCSPDGDPAGAEAEVLVADSASTDGSMETMRRDFPKVRCIPLDENHGYAGGYDRALGTLRDEPFKYYVLLNSDIDVRDGWLEPLVRYMDDNADCAACGPKLHSFQDRDSFEYAGAAGGHIDKYGYPFCRGRVMSMVEKDEGQYDTATPEVFWATGACLMVRAKDFWDAGGLDEDFFAHMEEIDLCWRLQLEGKRICVVPQSVVWHLGGGTLPQSSPWKLRLNFRNNLLMLSKNLSKTYASAMARSGKAEGIAAKACRKARLLILRRMVLDGCSAAAYLLSGKLQYFKAVVAAHREYKSMRKTPSVAEVEEWLRSGGNKAQVHGAYGRWLIPQAIFRKKRIFALVRKLATT